MDHVGKSGKTVWFYGCSGPAAELDPASYYRGLSWYAAKYNAEGIMFWAFGSTGGSGSSWNPYGAKAPAYSPFFVDDESVHTTKQMEAIREGMYDYEYILSARKKIAELKNAGKTAEAAEGERVLEQQFANIISHDIQKFDWNSRSRGVDKLEDARLSVLHWLVKTWEPSDRSNVKMQTKPVGKAAAD